MEPELHADVDDVAPRRAKAETRATWLFALSAAASIALAVVYWRGGQPQLEGLLLATISGGIGAAVVTWAKHSLPHDEVTEDRHSVESTDEDVEAFADDFERIEVEHDPAGVGRRRALVVAATAALGAFGAALIFPLRSLGPRPGKGLKVTPYRGGGMRVVTDEGTPVRPDDIAVGGIVTVWPEGHVGAPDASTLLIRTRRSQEFVPRPGREDWRVDDVVAYSKLCTHVGCPVGLYQSEEALLLCPCHQSTFAVLDGARPIFGPAARSLPQLPLGVNDDGELIAEGDFSGPVGPGFWGPRPVTAPAKGSPCRGAPLMRRTARWLDRRLGAADFARTALNKVFPDHWSFMIGELALYCFVVLVVTGVYLTFFFVPSTSVVTYHGPYAPLRGVEMSAAYESALRISFEVRAGLVMRQIHHWAALLFLASIVVHLARVFFTGAFRRPREINWMVGVTLLILAIVNGFAGYSLLDDQLSGTGLRIAYGVVLSVPIIGTWIASLLFGGEFPGEDIIGRLYTLHILIIPVIIGLLVAMHLAILVRHKHTQFRGRGREEHNVVGERLWPTYAAKAVGLLFLTASLLSFLGGVFQINPIWIFGPFDPAQVSAASQPDWYMGWLDGALRIFPGWEIRLFGWEVPNPFFPGALLGGLTFGLLFVWPFLEARVTGDHDEHHLLDRPRQRPVRTAVGVATLAFYFVLFLGGVADVIASTFDVSVNRVLITFRVLVFVVPVACAWVTYRLCRELADRDGLEIGSPVRFGQIWHRLRRGGDTETSPER